MPTRQGGTVANRDSNRPRGFRTRGDRAALIYGDCSFECLIAVKRHPEVAPGRHEELTPRVSGVKQAASERAIHSAVASERLAVVRAALKFFSPTLFRLQQVFAEARCGAFPLSGSCHRGS